MFALKVSDPASDAKSWSKQFRTYYCRHRGGGNKRPIVLLIFDAISLIFLEVETIEYDPNRTAFIAKVLYKDGERRYILCPQDIKRGDQVVSSASADIKPGNCLPLKNIPFGTLIHNIEMKPGKGGQIARTAGSFCRLAGRTDGYAC